MLLILDKQKRYLVYDYNSHMFKSIEHKEVLERIDEFDNVELKCNRCVLEEAIWNIENVEINENCWKYRGTILFVRDSEHGIVIDSNGHKIDTIKHEDELYLSVDGHWLYFCNDINVDVAVLKHGAYIIRCRLKDIIGIYVESEGVLVVYTYSFSGRGNKHRYFPDMLDKYTKSQFMRNAILGE